MSGSDGSFDRIVAVGIPVARTLSGWWELPSPVAACLISQAPVTGATVLAAAGVYARHGEALSAIRTLLGAGLASELRSYLEQHGTALASANGPELHAALGDLLSEVDGGTLTGEFADYLAASVRDGLEHGFWGWFDDDVAFARDWGFELDAITQPVTIWQGAQDRFVPFAHRAWLAGHVAGARPRLLPDDGHLSIAIGSYDRVLDDLIASGG